MSLVEGEARGECVGVEVEQDEEAEEEECRDDAGEWHRHREGTELEFHDVCRTYRLTITHGHLRQGRWGLIRGSCFEAALAKWWLWRSRTT